MAPYSVSPTALASLAGSLDDARDLLTEGIQQAVPLLLDHGYATSAQIVLAGATGSERWCETWAGSLRERVAMIAAMARVAVADRSLDLRAAWVQQRRWVLHAGADALTWAEWSSRGATELLMAAGAMLLGRSPDEVGLDPAVFPNWYVASHRRGERTRAGVAAVLAFLDDASLAGGPQQHELVGVLLARLFSANAGDPTTMQAIAGLFARHVDSTAEAVAFFNALPPHLLQAITAAGGLSPYDEPGKAAFMAPFAAGLAVASHSPNLTIDVAELVGRRDSGYWFTSEGYDPHFLIGALVAALAAAERGDIGHVQQDGEPRDVRTSIMQRLAASPVAPAAVAGVAAAGLLAEYVDPVQPYPDDGAAAGHLLGLLGQSRGGGIAGLIVEVMGAIAATGGPSGVVQGAAAMVQPHVGAFTAMTGPTALPASPLREALDDLGAARDQTVSAFLERLMSDVGAANAILLGYSAALAAAVATNLDPEQPDSVAATFAEAGRLFDLIAAASLGPQLSVARRSDRGNRALAGLIGVATDLALGFGVGKLAVQSTTQLAIEGVWGGLADVALPLAGFELLPMDQAEAVLLAGYELERDAVLQAQLLLAVYLDAAGRISLPAAWWREGRLELPSRQAWEAFVVELRAEAFPVDAWFNHAAAIGGYVDLQPATD